MKLNLDCINRIEKEQGVISLFNLRKSEQYLYLKVKKSYPHLIVDIPVETLRGKHRNMPFISLVDLEQLKPKKTGDSKVSKTRSFMGRPYSFCLSCDHKNNCSLDIPCEKRNEQMIKKQQKEAVVEDSRFWKNGVPKKSLVLCKSSKYKYAHKKSAGQCQKENCCFYSLGNCVLGLDK